MKAARRIAAAAILAVGASLGLTVAPASAGLSNCTIASDSTTSKKGLASFNGSASYDAAAGKLTITLKNTSASGRGFLTGFAFNAKGGAKASYMDGDVIGTRKDEDGFDLLKAAKRLGGVKCKPFGIYEAGAGLDGKFSSLKNAKRGVGHNASRTFVFDVTGADPNLTVTDLLGDGASLVANFRGFKKGKKDQVAARLLLLEDAPVIGDGTGAPIITVPGNNTTGPGDGNAHGNPNGNTPGGNGNEGVPSTSPPGSVVDPGTGSGGSPHAVPLPPAAWAGLGTMGLMAVSALRRRYGARKSA